ncbi:outer membrane protein assembly factor BamE domain-containing protein [Nitrospirillum amazonense]|uniref:outer membrane protein assembly factor BamE domain-containing protein n=1 Tax=Nitrospirillum amazonense TaxID=28077 RepID=UPI002412B01B|nr:outer membrane protein assembly factor BamE [Nitrospirillum amazonense]MDG3442453.1 outer membrane protein assembly factor BamE [Nitrospirillum amazonense]
MRKVMLLAAVAATLALSGCFSSGTKVSDEQVASLEKGKTTYDQVVAKLGKPQAVTTMSNGGKIAVYMFSKGSANAASYIPIAGAFVGGASGDSRSVTMTFNAAGTLVDYTTAESHVESNHGL